MVVDDLDGLVLAAVVHRDGEPGLPGRLVDEEHPPAGGGRAHSPGVALGIEGQAARVEVVQLAVAEGLVPGGQVDGGQPDGPGTAGLRGERVQQPRGGIEGDVEVLLLGRLAPDDPVVAAAEGSGHSGPGDGVDPEQHVLVADDIVHRIEGARGGVEGDAVHRGEGDGALRPRSRAEGAAERGEEARDGRDHAQAIPVGGVEQAVGRALVQAVRASSCPSRCPPGSRWWPGRCRRDPSRSAGRRRRRRRRCRRSGRCCRRSERPAPVTVQVKAAVPNRPPGSSARTTTE